MKSRSAILLLPNGNTAGLFAVVAGMWYAGASQGNTAAYLLCFFLAGIGMASAMWTWVNLSGLDLDLGRVDPAFAGGELNTSFTLRGAARREHHGVNLSLRGAAPQSVGSIARGESRTIVLSASAVKRGIYDEVRVKATSRFPLGFFTATRTWRFKQSFYIYPELIDDASGLRRLQAPSDAKAPLAANDGDFAGLRAWRPGESMRHIDWKAVARGQPFLSKLWEESTGKELILDWNKTSGADAEMRLRQLASWVVAAEDQGLRYGMKLPDAVRPAGRGPAHAHACLRLLAEFGGPRDS